MMPSPQINDHYDTCHSRLLAAGRALARIGPLNWPAVAPSIWSCNVRPVRSPRRAHPCFAANRSPQPILSNLSKPNPVAKSP